MAVARSDDQKLLLLAGLEFSPNAELWVHRDGGWEVDENAIYKAFNKHPYLDFSETAHFDEIEGVFKRKLDNCSAEDFRDTSATRLLLDAMRGFSYHLGCLFGSRTKPSPRKGKISRPEVGAMAAKRFGSLETRVMRFAIDAMKQRFTTRFGQRDFIAQDEILDGGVCFGISTHWCLRFILRKKESFASSKHSEGPGVIVDPTSKDVAGRMAKKAPMIYHLQHRQAETRKLKEKESLPVANFLWDKVENTDRHKIRTERLNTLYYERAGHLPSNYYGSVQNYINMKSLGHSAASIKKLRVVAPGRGGFGSFCYCLPPNGRALKDAVEQVFLEMSGEKPGAYIVSYRLTRTDDNKDTIFGDFVPYFIEEGRGGHAMGVITDGKGSWTFMDPNFGELNRKTKKQAQDFFTLLMSMYAIQCNIREFCVMEVVATHEGELDPKRAFIFS